MKFDDMKIKLQPQLSSTQKNVQNIQTRDKILLCASTSLKNAICHIKYYFISIYGRNKFNFYGKINIRIFFSLLHRISVILHAIFYQSLVRWLCINYQLMNLMVFVVFYRTRCLSDGLAAMKFLSHIFTIIY